MEYQKVSNQLNTMNQSPQIQQKPEWRQMMMFVKFMKQTAKSNLKVQ